MLLNIEDQVCSLEYSKELTSLGVKQESYFYWVIIPKNNLGNNNEYVDLWNCQPEHLEYYSAFTVAELGEIIKKKEEENKYIEIDYYTTYDSYHLTVLDKTRLESHYEQDCNEANARAKALITLIYLDKRLKENNNVPVMVKEKVNKPDESNYYWIPFETPLDGYYDYYETLTSPPVRKFLKKGEIIAIPHKNRINAI